MLQLYIFPDRSDYSTFCRIVNVFAHKGYLKSCQRPRPRTSYCPAVVIPSQSADWRGNPFPRPATLRLALFLSLRTSDRVTGVAIRSLVLRTAIELSFRASAHTGVGIRSPVPAPAGAEPFLKLPPAGYFCLQRQKYPKTPLETTFQDFLSALCSVINLPYVPRAIGFSVYRCRSKGLCHHSFPLPLPVATVGAFPFTAVPGYSPSQRIRPR